MIKKAIFYVITANLSQCCLHLYSAPTKKIYKSNNKMKKKQKQKQILQAADTQYLFCAEAPRLLHNAHEAFTKSFVFIPNLAYKSCSCNLIVKSIASPLNYMTYHPFFRVLKNNKLFTYISFFFLYFKVRSSTEKKAFNTFLLKLEKNATILLFQWKKKKVPTGTQKM